MAQTPEICDCCGSYVCSFVKDKPGNREARLDFIEGKRTKGDGTEATSVEDLATDRSHQQTY